jgi:hypothetical protein
MGLNSFFIGSSVTSWIILLVAASAGINLSEFFLVWTVASTLAVFYTKP